MTSLAEVLEELVEADLLLIVSCIDSLHNLVESLLFAVNRDSDDVV